MTNRAACGAENISECLRAASRAIPANLAQRVGAVRIFVLSELDESELLSQWKQTGSGLDIELAAEGSEPHDLSLEMFLCLGQALWESLTPAERRSYLLLLAREIDAGVSGEIDENALHEKQELFLNRSSAGSQTRLEVYARASFAATLAEYLHALWHDVTVREGPEHLPAPWLRRRLKFFQRCFPPEPGYPLFPPEPPSGSR